MPPPLEQRHLAMFEGLAQSSVCDSAKATDGRFVEILGYYNPRTSPETVEVDRERLAHWLSRGACPSDTVRTLIDRHPIAAVETAEAAETS